MIEARWSWFGVILGIVLGLLVLATGSGWVIWLGGLALLVSAGLALSELRRRGEPDKQPALGRIPPLTVLERLAPPLFYLLSALVVLAALLYTLRQLGYF